MDDVKVGRIVEHVGDGSHDPGLQSEVWIRPVWAEWGWRRSCAARMGSTSISADRETPPPRTISSGSKDYRQVGNGDGQVIHRFVDDGPGPGSCPCWPPRRHLRRSGRPIPSAAARWLSSRSRARVGDAGAGGDTFQGAKILVVLPQEFTAGEHVADLTGGFTVHRGTERRR